MKLRRLAARGLIVLGSVLVLQALWLPLKAHLAQHLLQRAYEQSPGSARPWPWADFAAAAMLRVPALGVEQIVLDQASPRALAFGPGLQAGSLAAESGRIVLAGHRDSHFDWLRDLRAGEVVELHSPAGVQRYQVTGSKVVDSRFTRIARGADGRGELLLTTCWPFDALAAGGPLRLAVTARRIAS